jgi:hypothetical protein
MDKNRRFFLSIVVVIFTALACNIVSDDPAGTPEPVGSGAILFQDDFSDTGSGWDRVSDSTTVTDYANGGYRMYVNETNYDVWANPGKNFTDVSVEVSATKIGGPDENDFGIICRYLDISNFYYLFIGSDGFFGIAAISDGNPPELIGMESMSFSGRINQGFETNVIRADCVGESLTLSVNGTVLADVTDNRFTSGDVGLIAGTFDEAGADIQFDNFIVRQP